MVMPVAIEMPNVHPLARVAPVIPVATIGDPLQELNARAVAFSKGKEYPAHVALRLEDNTFLVRVEQSLYKMHLGNQARVGQNLTLQYLYDSPLPTFALSQHLTASSDGTGSISANVSSLGHLIDESIKHAELSGATTTYHARYIVSFSPAIPKVLAGDLKKTLESSGLFYESHLKDYLHGQRTLSELKTEPQNQYPSAHNALLPQQLAIMEHQRLSWHGEVWSGQKMDWNIHFNEKSKDRQNGQVEEIKSQNISTDLTLHLPKLGKVTAKISIADGRMCIGLQADDANTRLTLKSESGNLINAILQDGQTLEGFTVAAYE